MHRLMEDFSVWAVSAIGIIASYITAENTLRWIVLLVSLGFTLRRWYIMEKKNRNNNN